MNCETFVQDQTKTIEVVLYLCQQSRHDHNFCISKLTKLLYYADTASYMKRGHPITGSAYLHLPHGPHPERWHVINKAMQLANDVEVIHHDVNRYYQSYLFVPLRNPDLSILNDEDVAILDEQMERFRHFNAAGIEQNSQEEIAWRATEDGEPMDYLMAGFAAPPLSVNSILHGREIAQQVAARRATEETTVA